MEVVCLAVPLAEGTWVRVSRASRRLMEIDAAATPDAIKICYGGATQLDWAAVELAARAETQRVFHATRPGPGGVRQRFVVLRNLYEFALGVGLLISAQGMAIPALAGLWLLGKSGLRTRRRTPRLHRPGSLSTAAVIRSAHAGLARLGELIADEEDERMAYMGASALARSLALPEAEHLYERMLAGPAGLHPGRLAGVWLAPAAGLDRPLLTGAEPQAAPPEGDADVEIIDAGAEPMTEDEGPGSAADG